jgi:N,N-dimethylformamidase
MYYKLKAWVFERGGKLLYLGGNGLNCEVEFLDESTMRVRNSSIGSNGPLMRERGMESRFGVYNESEAHLLGVVYSDAGVMTAAPYRVVDETHWVFEGTGLKNGDIFGQESLHMRVPGGASGHETDKMSPHSPQHTRLLAKGLNPDDGGAEMVIHETESGGAVFSVGSITYVSSIVVDEHISKITANVLKRFLD